MILVSDGVKPAIVVPPVYLLLVNSYIIQFVFYTVCLYSLFGLTIQVLYAIV